MRLIINRWRWNPERQHLLGNGNGSKLGKSVDPAKSEENISTDAANLRAEARDEIISVDDEVSNESSNESCCGCKRHLGLIYAIISIVVIALYNTINKMYSHINVLTLWLWAYIVVILISVIVTSYAVFVQKKNVTENLFPILEHKKIWILVLIRGAVTGLLSYFTTLALTYISVADTRTIMAGYVIFVYFFGWLFLREQCGAMPIILSLIAFCGVGIMIRPPMLTGEDSYDMDTLKGMFFAMCCILLRTTGILTVRYLRNVNEGILVLIRYIWALGQTGILALLFGKLELPASLDDLGAIIIIGLLTAIGSFCMIMALQKEEAGVIALVRTLDVILAFVWQFLLIGIIPDLFSILGAVMILTCVTIATVRKWVGSLEEDNYMRVKLRFLLL